MDDRGEQTGCGRAVQGSSRLVVVSCCQSSPSVCPRGPQSVTQPDTNPTAFRGRRWIHAFLLSERAPPRGLKAETHPNCVRETGQSATRVCVRASATLHTTRSIWRRERRPWCVRRELVWRWLCPEPAVQFRFPPLVRGRTAPWRSTRCTTKFGGLNKLGGQTPPRTWKNRSEKRPRK